VISLSRRPPRSGLCWATRRLSPRVFRARGKAALIGAIRVKVGATVATFRGDVVTVTRIDRLARRTFDLFAIVKQIVDAKAQFQPLVEPWADTTTSHGRLMLIVLGGLAEFERDLIRARTGEGRKRAKARGATLQELAHSYNGPRLCENSRVQFARRKFFSIWSI
jgi:DNA invertase Pin-like site-specific DNA recombinase